MSIERFVFEDIGDELKLIPLAARRALDAAGRKLPLAAWQAMPIATRQALVACGVIDQVEVERVLDMVSAAKPEATAVAPEHDPSTEAPPTELVAALGARRPLAPERWCSLAPLARYALVKVGRRGGSERLDQAYDEIIGGVGHAGNGAPHWNERGEAHMVDVGAKPPTARAAVAAASVEMSASAFSRLCSGNLPKGDVLGTARIAGIQAAKRTSELIPLCHVVAVTGVDVDFTLDQARHAIDVRATVRAFDRTGVEMEALVAASVAALTVYDMLKGLDRAMVMGKVMLLEKSGGRSGHFQREPSR